MGSLISRLIFFYESPGDDERLHKMSEVLLKKSQEVLDIIRRDQNRNWNKRLSAVLIANLRMLQSGGTSQSLVLPLRLVEIYACPSGTALWLQLVKSGYFTILKYLIVSRCPEVNEKCEKAPTPLAESLVSFVKKPLESCRELDDKCKVISNFLDSFFGDPVCSSIDCRIFHMVLPLIAACDNKVLPAQALIRSALLSSKDKEANTIWKLHAIVTIVSSRVPNLSEQDVVNYLIVLREQLFDLMLPSGETNVLAYSRTDQSLDSEEDMDFEVNENVMKRTAIERIWSLLNKDDFVQKVVTGVETVKSLEALIAVCSVSYVMQARIKHSLHKCPLLCKLVFRPPFLRLLWQTVSSVHTSGDTEHTSLWSNQKPLLHTLSSGRRLSKNDTLSFLPLLVCFCSLFGLLLPTIYETEFYHEISEDMPDLPDARSSMMPFSLSELASIAMQLRDVALGLIELSFPDTHSSSYWVPKESYLNGEDGNVEMWLALFHNVVQLLRQLYSRDCRKKFCDNWIVNVLVVPDQVTDANLKRPYLKRQPFQHFVPKNFQRLVYDDGPQASTGAC